MLGMGKRQRACETLTVDLTYQGRERGKERGLSWPLQAWLALSLSLSWDHRMLPTWQHMLCVQSVVASSLVSAHTASLSVWAVDLVGV